MDEQKRKLLRALREAYRKLPHMSPAQIEKLKNLTDNNIKLLNKYLKKVKSSGEKSGIEATIAELLWFSEAFKSHIKHGGRLKKKKATKKISNRVQWKELHCNQHSRAGLEQELLSI